MRAVACTEAPATAKEHSTGQEERAGHPQSVSGVSKTSQTHTDTDPLHPSAHPAHLQSRLFRSFGQRSGARATGETLKLSESQSKHVSTSPLQAFGQAPLTLKLCVCEKPTRRLSHVVCRGVGQSAKTALQPCSKLTHLPSFTPLGSASWSLLR